MIGRGAVLRARLNAAEEALSSGHLEDFQVAMAPVAARIFLIPVKEVDFLKGHQCEVNPGHPVAVADE